MQKNNKSFSRHKRILLLIIALNLTIISLSVTSFAWFASINRTGSIMFSAGNVRYNLEQTDDYFIDTNEIIKPGQELVNTADGIPIVNRSTVTTHLRMKIIVSYDMLVYDDDVGEWITRTIDYQVTDSNSGDVIAGFATNNDQPLWIYNSTSKYFEYQGNGTNHEILLLHNEQDIRIDATLYSVTSLKINGNIVGNDTSLQNVKVNITFEAKQADYVSWDDLGSVFSLTSMRKFKTYQIINKIN